MAFKFAVIALAIFVVAEKVTVGCYLAPSSFSSTASLSSLRDLSKITLPSSIPCAPVQTKITQHPDISIPLPLPAEIPLGNFCNCQKYDITPTLLPCSPAAAPAYVSAPAPAYVSAPAPAYFSAPAPAYVSAPSAPASPALSLSTGLLQALLGSRPAACPAAAPAPAPTCGWA